MWLVQQLGHFTRASLSRTAQSGPSSHCQTLQCSFPRPAIQALSEENYLLAQTNILNLATIDFSRFIRIGLSEYTPFHEFRVFL
jgi:hypothetical protein